jgi:hypothetical protein
MPNYKGIEFAKGYNRSLAEFKEEFGSNHIFKKFQAKQREQELKKAHKIATNQKVKDEIVVEDAKTIEPDGDITPTVGSSEKADTTESK